VSRDRGVLDVAEAWKAAPEGVLCTLVDAVGSSYRKVGARALFGATRAGTLSGGCLERDLGRRGSWLSERGPTLVRYDASLEEAEDDGRVGLGCGGEVTILVERARPGHPALDAIASAAFAEETARIATVVSPGPWLGAAISVSDSRLVASAGLPPALVADLASIARTTDHTARRVRHGELTLLVECVRPPPSLLVCGSGRDTAPVVAMATLLGWRVTTADRKTVASEVLAARAPDAAVVMTHSLAADGLWLRALLGLPRVRYVGLLGPPARADHLLARLRAETTLDDASLTKLSAPIGLDLGGEGPEALALAIVAELEAFRNGRLRSLSNSSLGRSRMRRAELAGDRLDVGVVDVERAEGVA
jgi:xanthine/CO dehydrogenase XdhC/CoxF family maturation factor